MMSRRLAACLFAITVPMVAQTSVAQPTADWPSAKKEMDSLSLAVPADCERAWELLWQWSKRGEREARISLSRIMLLGWIDPPGLNQDEETRFRHAYTFLLHALAEDDEEAIEGVKRMITVDRRLTQYSAQPYLDCVTSMTSSQRRACVDRLVAAGLVASFDSYARELDIVAAAPGAKGAYCSPNAFHSPARKK